MDRVQEIEKSKKFSIFSFILYVLLVSPSLADFYSFYVVGLCWLWYDWILLLNFMIFGYSCSYYSKKYYLLKKEDEILSTKELRIFLIMPFILMAFGLHFALLLFLYPFELIIWVSVVIFPIIFGILNANSNYNGRLPQKEIDEIDKYYGELIEEELKNLKLK